VQRGRGRGAWGAAGGRDAEVKTNPMVSSHINQDRAVHDQLDHVVGTLVKLVAK
jgi:hypothetical protein